MTLDIKMPFSKKQNKLTDYKIKYMKYKIKFLTLRKEMEGGTLKRNNTQEVNSNLIIKYDEGNLIQTLYDAFRTISKNNACYDMSNDNHPLGCTNYHTNIVKFNFKKTDDKDNTYTLISTPQKGQNAMYAPILTVLKNNDDVTLTIDRLLGQSFHSKKKKPDIKVMNVNLVSVDKQKVT